MKALIVLFAATTLALGAVCVVQWQQLQKQHHEITSLRSESEQTTAQVQELKDREVKAEQQKLEIAHHSDEVATQLIAQSIAESNKLAKAMAESGSGTTDGKDDKDNPMGGFGKMLGKMMDDPEMRKLIQHQQKQMMDQLYSPLLKQLKMTPEESDKFKTLLSENTMKMTEHAGSMFGGDGSTNRAAATAAIAEQQKSFDEQMKQLLGDSRYAQYKDYQETVGERTQLNTYRQLNGSGDSALSDEQTEKLLALMRDEKKNLAAAGQPFMNNNNQDPTAIKQMLEGDGVDKLMAAQEELNQRVLDRAKEILSPSQMNSFGEFQTNQLQTMKMGMKMAGKFFSPGKGGVTPQVQVIAR
jgi:hypothetical protein